MHTDLSLPSALVENLIRRLGGAPSSAHARTSRPGQLAVHVVYGGAHLFNAGTVEKLGERARAALDQWGANAASFGHAVGVSEAALAREVTTRVREKLARRAVEAMCIDFEDGYGPRSNDEEDAEASRTATELAKTSAPRTSIGIRIKALTGATVARSIRTLDLFVTTFARATQGRLREGFSVTLPKVTSPDEVGALVELLEKLEGSLGITRPIDVELMVESPRALIGETLVGGRHGFAEGETHDARGLAIPALVEAARGRASVVHLGAYDLTAELGVTAGDQRLDHPYCDLARMLLQLSVAGTSVAVSDGATTVLPIPPKNASKEESSAAVQRGWTLHAGNVRRALDFGIWRGWDLHPAQLPARYGALYAYFLEHRTAMTARLRSFVANATQASRVGQVFDDAATGEGLMTFFLRGLACGALHDDDVRETGLTVSELSHSFAEIVADRASSASR
jgi:citrate lyase beta subunit